MLPEGARGPFQASNRELAWQFSTPLPVQVSSLVSPSWITGGVAVSTTEPSMAVPVVSTTNRVP